MWQYPNRLSRISCSLREGGLGNDSISQKFEALHQPHNSRTEIFAIQRSFSERLYTSRNPIEFYSLPINWTLGYLGCTYLSNCGSNLILVTQIPKIYFVFDRWTLVLCALGQLEHLHPGCETSDRCWWHWEKRKPFILANYSLTFFCRGWVLLPSSSLWPPSFTR